MTLRTVDLKWLIFFLSRQSWCAISFPAALRGTSFVKLADCRPKTIFYYVNLLGIVCAIADSIIGLINPRLLVDANIKPCGLQPSVHANCCKTKEFLISDRFEYAGRSYRSEDSILGLHQKDVAAQIICTVDTITNWEVKHCQR